MKCIENRLRETIGLDAATVGPGMVQRALRHRMRSLGLKRPEDYVGFLERSRAEWQELVESVVVTETWFFREPGPIAAFVRLVVGDWLPAHPAAALRLLSVPCASGEEPFSLVMALRNAGVPADRFEVEGVDISARALGRASRGIYGRNSFRGKELAFRDRHFQPAAEGFVLDPAVRRCVRFRQGNFLSDAFLPGEAGYDFIFCRNLLIYLEAAKRRQALDKLERLLKPEGCLFVGSVEQPLAIEHGFRPAGIPLAFACRKATGGAGRPRRRLAPRTTGAMPDLPLKREFEHEPGMELETARRLADAGRLEEAAEICQAHLREHRASAQAYYLLGLVRDARGEPDALDCYRRALYLDPQHYESLLQMAGLLETRGEAARARAFQRRALRVQPPA